MTTTTANQFIGSKISLISKSEIRYEGILYALDLQDATISLAKVKSFGTEDRPTERPVPPKEEVYEFIIFRGTDIKGIDVLEPPKAAPTLTSGLPNDPAIVEVSHYHSSGQPSQGGSRSNASTPNLFSSRKSPTIDSGAQVPDDTSRDNNSRQYNSSREGEGRRSRQSPEDRRRRQSSEDRRRQQQNRQSQGAGGGGQVDRQSGYQPRGRGQYANNYRGGFRGGRGGNRGGGYRPQGIIQAQMPPKVTFNDPYDFDKANKELQNVFSKLKVTKSTDEEKKEGGEPEDGGDANNLEQENKEPAEPFYVKDSFFDKISCESTERSKGKGTRIDWRAERKLNAETFGVPVNNGQRRGGGGFRGFRGGYQGYRGGGGGGYQQRGGYGYNNSYGYYQYNNRYNNGGRGQRGGYRQQQQQQPSSQQQQPQPAATQ